MKNLNVIHVTKSKNNKPPGTSFVPCEARPPLALLREKEATRTTKKADSGALGRRFPVVVEALNVFPGVNCQYRSLGVGSLMMNYQQPKFVVTLIFIWIIL